MAEIPETPDEKMFNHLRHQYLRVSTQVQTRLTVSTFLAGLTFAAFAALLSQTTIETPLPGDIWQHRGKVFRELFTTNLGDFLFVVSGMLLALTALYFLLAAVSTYAALLRLADVSPSIAKLLTDDIAPGDAVRAIDSYDADRIACAYAIYSDSEYLIPWGLTLTFVAVPFFAFHINLFTGIVAFVATLVFAFRLPPLLRGVITLPARRRSGPQVSP